MKKQILTLSVLALSLFSLNSCKKNKGPKGGMVHLNIDNVIGTEDLKMDGSWYINPNGDSFTVTKFNYYISNVVLSGDNGSTYAEEDSYHLVEEENGSTLNISIPYVESGNYNKISFMIGVDSLHNVSGAQSGDLDPAKGMFWSWNSGYIMLKFEGNSPVSTQPDNKLMFHIGGFNGEYNTLKTVTFTLPQAIHIDGNEAYINLQADLMKVFGAPNTVSFKDLSLIHMPGLSAFKISNNYANMFSITASGQQ